MGSGLSTQTHTKFRLKYQNDQKFVILSVKLDTFVYETNRNCLFFLMNGFYFSPHFEEFRPTKVTPGPWGLVLNPASKLSVLINLTRVPTCGKGSRCLQHDTPRKEKETNGVEWLFSGRQSNRHLQIKERPLAVNYLISERLLSTPGTPWTSSWAWYMGPVLVHTIKTNRLLL